MTRYTLTGTLRCILFLACVVMLISLPVQGFTADSLEISVEESGDAIATFHFTLQGMIENAIPQSTLEDELLKGFGTSSEPPELISMDRSTAVFRMKKFASISDVPTGYEYRTVSMNFNKAEIALQSSALSSIVSADFSPATMKVIFPDNYERTFSDSSALPSITHIIIDPDKAASAVQTPATTGAAKIISTPSGIMVEVDGAFVGTAPDTFMDIPEGSHTFRFSRENYEPVTKTIDITAGQTVQVTVFLNYVEPTPASKTPGFGAILTSSRYWKRYEGGHYHQGTTHLYVSRGLGMEGFGAPRARFFCPPEVVSITICGAGKGQ